MKILSMKKANQPLDDTNVYLAGNATCNFTGITDETFRFVEGFHLTDAVQWARFVEQYRVHSDSEDKGWKGEFWGKLMRGASFVYAYTKNPKLYDVLSDTVEDMMSACDANGRISTYRVDEEFTGWDMWCRKYVLLGMEYFLEICESDEFAERIVDSMKHQVNYIISKIGPSEEGKLPINQSAIFWRGMSASSILEPVVRLYNITKEKSYLDFAEYIVEAGGTSIANIFKLAYENELYPYQYPVTKAYEMISCFEGLLEFYRVNPSEWYREALIHFADSILETDFTIIGCSGCTHELFDHSSVRQANPNKGKLMQETCVTVTLMKFFYQMTLLTGNPAYADAFERSYYNAYLGAVNTEGNIGIDVRKIYNGAYPNAIAGALPFDSYSPLTAGTRGGGIGGVQVMHDQHYYGCCACIGSAGIGVVPKMALLKSKSGFVMNLYLPGTMQSETATGQPILFTVDTEYPKSGVVKINLQLENPEIFSLALRNPEWNEASRLEVNGESISLTNGYVELERCWKDGDEILFVLDMRTKVIYPKSYGSQVLMTEMLYSQDYVVPRFDKEDPTAKDHIALRRGPVVLAIDSQLGYDAGAAFDIDISMDSYVETSFPETELAPYKHMLEVTIPLKNKTYIHATDYASAGKLWNEESKMAAWIRTRE